VSVWEFEDSQDEDKVATTAVKADTLTILKLIELRRGIDVC